MKKYILSIALIIVFFTTKAQLIVVPKDTLSFDISNDTIANTIIKRKVFISDFNKSDRNESISITGVVKYYADSTGDTYGSHLNMGGIKDYVKKQTANDNMYVDSVGNSISLPYAGHYYTAYGFFSLIARSQPVVLDQMELSVAEKLNWN